MKDYSVPLPQIFVHNRQRKISVSIAPLRQFARAALTMAAREGGPGLTTLPEIHVLLISDRRIAELHERFMQIPGPTDVITFQHGEIFISVETARRQARVQRTSLGEELQLYLLHGLLHLHGFDDREAAARARMQKVQELFLSRLTSGPD